MNRSTIACELMIVPTENTPIGSPAPYRILKSKEGDYIMFPSNEFPGTEYRGQHLHLISQESIEDGDWCILLDSFGNSFMGEPQQYSKAAGHVLNKGLRKVIASTDHKLDVLHISDYTIINAVQYYNKFKGRVRNCWVEKLSIVSLKYKIVTVYDVNASGIVITYLPPQQEVSFWRKVKQFLIKLIPPNHAQSESSNFEWRP